MKLGIVTVNYNNTPATLTLLNSIYSQLEIGDRFYIVDNGSEDTKKLQESVQGKEGVELIKNRENLGFAGGNNLGIQRALRQGSGQGLKNEPDWIVLLNNDTRVDPSFLAILKANLKGLEPSIVSIPLMERGEVEGASAQDRTAYAGKVKWLAIAMPHVYEPIATSNMRHETSLYAIGAGMAIHKAVFEKIGFMDEKYFLYFEDVDFSIKARRGAIPIHFLTEPVAHHSVSASTSKLGQSKILYYHARNAMRFNFRNGPFIIKLATLVGGVFIILEQTCKILLRIHKEESLAILNGVKDFYLNKYGEISL